MHPLRSVTGLTTSAVVAALCVLAAGDAFAQAEDMGPLYLQSPFDRVVLKDGTSIDVRKIRYPDGSRTPPAVFPQVGALTVNPLQVKNASAVHSVPWNAITRIDQFEDLIMQRALELSAEKKFDEAFPYFSHLLRRAPQTKGLSQAITRYLQANALDAFQREEYDLSLAILGSLYDRSPNAGGLKDAVDRVANEIILQQLKQRNYSSARVTLEVVAETFRGLPLSVVAKWRQKFEQAANGQLKEAKRFLASQDYLAARDALGQAVGVWPELSGVDQLRQQIQREHPVVTVGVVNRSPLQPSARLDSRASLRTSPLVSPAIVELRGYTSEGGEYKSSGADLELDTSGLAINFQLMEPATDEWLPTGLAASALGRRLINATDPDNSRYSRLLADLIDEVQVEYPSRVRVKFRRPHVRPESLMQLAMPADLVKVSSRGLYEVADYGDELVRFQSTMPGRTSIAEVHERTFPDDDQAVTALIRGTVDAIDRVPPWQMPRLKAVEGVEVGRYRLPTIHALVPTGRSPLTDQREFRRALCYGIDRQKFVDDYLLAGGAEAGFQVVSGPFPAGTAASDPVRYGYNGQIDPRVYDPYMAIVLSTAAWSNARKMAGEKEPGDEELPRLTLGHSPDPIARAACQEISKNLNAVNIPIKLVELSAAELLDASDHVDLKYVELSTWEPVTDARVLLGSKGLVGGTSDFMAVALDRLDAARNWKEVIGRLHEIHEAASIDLPVIPLWQTMNYFAYRKNLSGLADEPVLLYQNVARWELDVNSERL